MSRFHRRQFLAASTAAGMLAGLRGLRAARGTAPASGKAPYRVVYSNDTTNITSCVSPWHAARQPFQPAMLEASVDEVAGRVDAHFLQPGLGMVPMWPSKVLPLEEHYAWIKARYGQGPDSFGRYVLGGGDVIRVFVERCRRTGQAPFVSFRLNDAHHKEFADPKPGDRPGASIGMSVTRHYVEHPEYRLAPGSKRGADLVQNWSFADVRAQKLALIAELCTNYDIDGLELDFMRYYRFFDESKTTVEARRQIMTGFVRSVRDTLDRTTRDGRHRWLCVRIPALTAALDPLGIDLAAFRAAGVEMVNASSSYFTTQQAEVAALRRLSGDAALYVELCHSTWNGEKLVAGYDTFPFRRATPEQLQTTAHLGYARGADGVSLFNFAYYREHGGPGRGPFAEPPFHVLKHLGDPDWLSREPQHYFLAPGWNNPFVRPSVLPRRLEPGTSARFTLDLASTPKPGQPTTARLRLQASASLEDTRWSAAIDGRVLTPSADVSELFPAPYPSLLGEPDELRAWTIATLKNGPVELTLTLEAGRPSTIVFLDLAVG